FCSRLSPYPSDSLRKIGLEGALCAVIERLSERNTVPPASEGQELLQISIPVVVLLIILFYGGTLLMSYLIGRKKENADDYMTAGNNIGFGEIGRASCREGV